MLGLFQNSRTKSEPITLYRFEYGIGLTSKLLLTDYEGEITVGGEVYQPVQIRHDNIVVQGTLDKATLPLYTSRDNPLVELFRLYPPDGVVNLLIYQGEARDPDAEFKVVWGGRVLNMGIENSIEAKFSCEPGATGIRRPGLRRHYQYSCPHIVYGPHCRANKVAASRSSAVVAVEGGRITLPATWFGPNDPVKYIHGMVEWTGPAGNTVSRSILQVVSLGGLPVQLLLTGVATGLSVGSTVTVVLGCNHTMSDCKELHNNLPNFGGCPWISKINPLAGYNNFY